MVDARPETAGREPWTWTNSDVKHWFKKHMPEAERPEWQMLMSKMPLDPRGKHVELDTWEKQEAWFSKLLDIHGGEAVLVPLKPAEIPWKWKGLCQLKEEGLVPKDAWPKDVAAYVSEKWPFSHASFQWKQYCDAPTYADTLTQGQEQGFYVPDVGADQPCRILARPREASAEGQGA